MARHRFIGTNSALAYAEAIFGRDAWSIVLHHDTESLARCETAIDGCCHAHNPAAPLASIVEYIAEQLRQIPAIADELTLGCNHQLD
jgi:hypothetical protein